MNIQLNAPFGRRDFARLSAFAAVSVTLPNWVSAAPVERPIEEESPVFQARLRSYYKAPEPEYTTDDIKAEIIFGRELAAKVIGTSGLVKDSKKTQYANRIAALLAQYSKRSEIDYRVGILATDEVNAYAAPGGYVLVTQGAFNSVEDESELAAIIAHEIGHIQERHIVKALNIRSQEGDAEEGFMQMLNGGSAGAVAAFNKALEASMDILFQKGLGQAEDEYEADAVSTSLLAASGYDPTALDRYLSVLKGKTVGMEVLNRTHPPLQNRLDKMQAFMAEQKLSALPNRRLKERLNENRKS